MSSIGSVPSESSPYRPITPAKPAVQQPKPAPASGDADHDGDTDGKGLDIKG